MVEHVLEGDGLYNYSCSCGTWSYAHVGFGEPDDVAIMKHAPHTEVKMSHDWEKLYNDLAGFIEDTLSPVLGYEAFNPGEPGYSENQVNWNIGEHVPESLILSAARALVDLREHSTIDSSGPKSVIPYLDHN